MKQGVVPSSVVALFGSDTAREHLSTTALIYILSGDEKGLVTSAAQIYTQIRFRSSSSTTASFYLVSGDEAGCAFRYPSSPCMDFLTALEQQLHHVLMTLLRLLVVGTATKTNHSR